MTTASPGVGSVSGEPLPGHWQQAPAHYRLRAGSLRITAFCDGYLALPSTLFSGATEADAAELARRAFLTPGPLPTAVNAFVVEAGDRTILIDAGVGPSRGPATGRLPAEMRAAGIDPSSVGTVLLTHMHGDHVGGLIDAAGEKQFPQAEVLVPAPELAFWRDPGLPSRAPEVMQPAIRLSNLAMDLYGEAVGTFEPGNDPAPGIRSVPLPGHTPGHTGFILGDGSDAVLVWGDIVHVAAYQFVHPAWGLLFDVDQAAAAATRSRIFAQAAAERMRVAGMHLAFPGVGYVVQDHGQLRYQAEAWQPLD